MLMNLLKASKEQMDKSIAAQSTRYWPEFARCFVEFNALEKNFRELCNYLAKWEIEQVCSNNKFRDS